MGKRETKEFDAALKVGGGRPSRVLRHSGHLAHVHGAARLALRVEGQGEPARPRVDAKCLGHSRTIRAGGRRRSRQRHGDLRLHRGWLRLEIFRRRMGRGLRRDGAKGRSAGAADARSGHGTQDAGNTPLGLCRVTVAADADGKVIAWDSHHWGTDGPQRRDDQRREPALRVHQDQELPRKTTGISRDTGPYQAWRARIIRRRPP